MSHESVSSASDTDQTVVASSSTPKGAGGGWSPYARGKTENATAHRYGPSTASRRRSRAQVDALDDAIVEAVQLEAPVTLRGVFYRVVSAGAVEKTELGYRAVGRRLLALRRAGRVDYRDITDGTRWITKPTTWSGVDQMLDDAAVSYRRGLWHDSRVQVMVFTEKDAISGVLLPVTQRWDVPLGVMRGYCSESFAWSVAQSIAAVDKTAYVYQFGDHDPSGVGAWQDFRDKVTGFLDEWHRRRWPAFDVPAFEADTWVRFDRLAVTEAQIEQWSLPTRPTKRTDPRADRFSGNSVEVDAIPASTLRDLAQQQIESHIDPEQLRLTEMAERNERELLLAMRNQLADRP